MTRAIVATNVVVFLAMLADGAGLFGANSAVYLRWGANFGPATKEGEWWRLLASTFMHFGLVHIAMNMWALWGAGGLVERLYGNFRFLVIYLYAGVSGGFASLYWNADMVVSAGASGAIFGVYGALGAFALREPGSVPKTVLRSLATSTAAFIGYSIVLGVMVPTIDNAAHAGGLAGGFALAWFLARPLEPFAVVRSGHAWSTAIGVVFAAVSIATMFLLLPPAKYSYAAQQAATEAIRAFAAEEDALAKKSHALVEERKAGRISDGQLGEAIAREILPGWSAAYARLSAIGVEPGSPVAARLAELTTFVRVRRDMFSAYAEGLRSGDAARMRRAEELSNESQAMMKAMRERAK